MSRHFRSFKEAPRGPGRLQRPRSHPFSKVFNGFSMDFEWIFNGSKAPGIGWALLLPAAVGRQRLGGALAMRRLHQQHSRVPHLGFIALPAAGGLRHQAAGPRLKGHEVYKVPIASPHGIGEADGEAAPLLSLKKRGLTSLPSNLGAPAVAKSRPTRSTIFVGSSAIESRSKSSHEHLLQASATLSWLAVP